REHRRARADDDPLVAALKSEPSVVTLALAEGRMQNGDPVAKRGPEAIDRLRCERYLGHQHDRRLAALIDDAAQQLDVDERLAAAGDPVQEENGALLRI